LFRVREPAAKEDAHGGRQRILTRPLFRVQEQTARQQHD